MARMNFGAWIVGASAAAGLFLISLNMVLAQEQPTAAQIIEALKPKVGSGSATRALSALPQSAPDRQFIDSLRNRQTRLITVEERAKAAEIAKEKPSIDLEITFDYNSDAIGPNAVPTLVNLG